MKAQLDSFINYLAPLAKKDKLSFDFYAWKSQANKISYDNKKLKSNTFSSSQNFCLRLLKDKKSASSYTKDFSKEAIEECYKQALDSLNLSDNEKACQLSKSQNYKEISLYNPNSSSMDLLKKIDKIKMTDEALLKAGDKVQPIANVVTDGESHFVFGNSEGVKGNFSDSFVGAYSYCLAVNGDKRASAFAQDYGRDYKDIDFKKLGEKSASKSLKKLEFLIPKTGNYPVIFDCETASPTMISLLLGHLSASSIYEKKSLLSTDFIGEKKFSELFSLHDDPFVSWGLSSAPFDGEGFAAKKVDLIEKGVIKNYLSDSFCSESLKIPHTAKASRSEDGTVHVSSTNIIMEQGKDKFEDFVKEQKTFVVIDQLKSMAGYNAISGDFSIEAEGFLWEQGKETPISQLTVSGNLIDVFSKISKVFDDSSIYSGTIKSSSFLVPKLSIAGQ